MSEASSNAESHANHSGGPPTPPPLPPLLVSARPPHPDTEWHPPLVYPASIHEDYHAYEPIHYFLYGTLTDPAILREVLGLETEPVLRSAKVYGYEITHRGQHEALVEGEQGAVVRGCAFMVQSVEDEGKLAHHETNALELAPCTIYFTDSLNRKEEEDGVTSKTFKYAGDAEALKEGRFDSVL